MVLPHYYHLANSKKRYVILRGGTRCLTKGTEVRTSDGRCIKVENIKVGDYISTLEGSDIVIDIHSGTCNMYEITQGKGISYTVTEDHLLCVRQVRPKTYKIYGDELRKLYPKYKYRSKEMPIKEYDEDKIYTFTAKEWSEMSERKRRCYAGFKNTFIELPKKENKIDPYYLGLWLGDGTTKNPNQITTTDVEIVDYLKSLVSDETYLYRNKITYTLRHKKFNHQTQLSKDFYNYNLYNNKHIPEDYIYTCYEDRLKLLAGLVDSDGYSTKRNTLSICQKRKHIIEQVEEILNISGFFTNGIRSKISKMKRKDGSVYECETYYIEFNHPDFKDLNKYIKVKRKQIHKDLSNDKHMFNTKIKSRYIGEGVYYGFTLAKCPYFRLKDGTITHNSGKTHAIIQYLLTIMISYGNVHIVVAVETLRQARSTVIQDIDHWIHEFGLYSLMNINKSEFTYEYNGNLLRILPTDKPSRWYGVKADIFWFNESTFIDKEVFEQAQMRLPDEKPINKIILDFNPTNPYSWCRELESDKNTEVFVSSYKDNPFLGPKQVELIESWKETNHNKWLIFGTGEYGEVRGAIITNWGLVDSFPKEINYWYGLDFGFTNDYTALVKVGLQNGEIYVDQMIYEVGLTNPDICVIMKELGITNKDTIIADSAEPKSIEEIRREGFNITGVKKTKDSINIGIDILQRYRINVTKRSKRLQDEFINYTWVEDRKTGNFINKPIDDWNHGIDAIRYVAISKLGMKHSGPTIIFRSIKTDR